MHVIIPQDDEERKMEAEEKAHNELEQLNRSMIDNAVQIVSDNKPATDLWPRFRQAVANYKKRRSEIVDLHYPKPELSGKYLGKSKSRPNEYLTRLRHQA